MAGTYVTSSKSALPVSIPGAFTDTFTSELLPIGTIVPLYGGIELIFLKWGSASAPADGNVCKIVTQGTANALASGDQDNLEAGRVVIALSAPAQNEYAFFVYSGLYNAANLTSGVAAKDPLTVNAGDKTFAKASANSRFVVGQCINTTGAIISKAR